MTGIRRELRFLLNDRPVTVAGARASTTLLDHLRLEERLRGSKEGCAEGDCGACTVLVGRLVEGEPVYETVNACIRLLGSVDGCHVVTIEHLKGPDGALHPVQQAMVDHHGSQCGFCTPGIVMSLYSLWMREENPDDAAIETALQGNLCRCTGYAPILRAARAASQAARIGDRLISAREQTIRALRELADGCRVDCGPEEDRILVPAGSDDLAGLLLEHPDATIIAGSTDVGLWVTKFMRDISPAIFIGNLDELQTIDTRNGVLSAGAGVSYSRLLPEIAEAIPQLAGFWRRIGGEQVRNMGTVGGNIANGSPIGDTPPPLIALGAGLTLRKGEARRTMPLQDFFIEYGKQDRAPGEFVERIEIPLPQPEDRFAAYKLSKRRDEDISAVCAGIRVRLGEDGTVTEAVIAFGGMAATPKRAAGAEAALTGRPFDEAALSAAMTALEGDFTPLSDWRASAEYRMLAARNLLRRFWLENRDGGEVATLRRERTA